MSRLPAGWDHPIGSIDGGMRGGRRVFEDPMSLSQGANDLSGWVNPQTLGAMSNPGADTRDSSSGFQGSALDQWGQPALAVGATTPEEMARVGYSPNSGLSFDQWLTAKGLTRMVRRTPGQNNSEVGYFDTNGNQVGQSIQRHLSAENDFLAGGIALAAPALWTVAAGAGGAGAGGAGAGGAGAGGAGGALGNAAFVPGADSALSGYAFNAAAPSAVNLGSAGGLMGTVATTGLGTAGTAAGTAAGTGGGMGGLLGNVSPEMARLGVTTGLGLLGSYQQSSAARDAAAAQQAGTNSAIAEQRRQYDLARGDFAPYRDTGVRALGQLEGDINTPTTAADVMQDPGYQFGLTQGQQALDRKIAAMGGRVSGAALKAAARFGNDYASQGYNAAYQRRQDRLNRLAALANIGQTSTGASAAAGQNMANNVSAAQYAAGNNAASAQIAQGNIWGKALGQAGGYLNSDQGRNDISRLWGNVSGTGMGGGASGYYPATNAMASGSTYGPEPSMNPWDTEARGGW